MKRPRKSRTPAAIEDRKIDGIHYSKHPVYTVWDCMIRRCYNQKIPHYKNYGGRGIRVCREWKNDSYAFCQWALSNGWEHGLHIDRIDNDGDYNPSNCRFVSHYENSQNKRSTVRLEAFGETKTFSQWAKDPRCKVSLATLRSRIYQHKWTPQEAISIPVMKGGPWRHRVSPEALARQIGGA